tara:strand:+ start:183 stop:422 length:240 start_codon:yes stop_codon:yes gene_type:complete
VLAAALLASGVLTRAAGALLARCAGGVLARWRGRGAQLYVGQHTFGAHRLLDREDELVGAGAVLQVAVEGLLVLVVLRL